MTYRHLQRGASFPTTTDVSFDRDNGGYRAKVAEESTAVASILGKDPPEVRYWIASATAPAFVKFEGPLFLKGPRWRIELSATRWPER